MSKSDYYDLLGCSKSASEAEIKKAFRTKAKELHPDRNSGNESATEKFKQVNEAYEILGDPNKRAAYDRYGHAAFEGASGRGGFSNFDFSGAFSDIFGSDIFDDFFDGFGGQSNRRQRRSSNQRGSDLRFDLSISLEEAYTGKQQEINYSSFDVCDKCSGQGAEPGSKPITCSTCGGQGAVRSSQGFFTIQQTCPQCAGSGENISDPCKSCSGLGKKRSKKKISTKIPNGVDDGTKIRLSGKGEAGTRGGGNGDLYIFMTVKPHNIFKRSGENLFFEFPISLTDAALGATIEVPTIDGGKAKVKIPPGTQGGKQFRLKGKGMPIIRGRGYGDLYIQTSAEVPVALSKEQKDLLEQFKKLENSKINPSIKNFFEKAKKFWSS